MPITSTIFMTTGVPRARKNPADSSVALYRMFARSESEKWPFGRRLRPAKVRSFMGRVGVKTLSPLSYSDTGIY